MTARKIFTLAAGALVALTLALPSTAAAQGFVDQRSAPGDEYGNPNPPGPPGTPPGHGGTPPGQGGTPPGQGNGKPKPKKGNKKGSGNVRGNGNKKNKSGSGTLGDDGSGVAGAGGSGGGPGGSVLGNQTGSLERSGSLAFTGLELWLLVALGLAALGAGLVTRRAGRGTPA